MPIDISVQICTYNRKEITLKSLESLFQQNYPLNRFEIIIVDDGSTDGTEEVISLINAPCQLIFKRQKNSGPAFARNAGLKLASGKYILFIDDDIIASKELLSMHMETHLAYPKSVVKGPIIHVDSLDNLDSRKYRFKIQDISTAFFPTGNSSVEKRYIEEAGMFDTDFKNYGWEDLELGMRLRQMGLKLRYNREAVTFHYKNLWKKSNLPDILKQARYKGINATIFLDKHPGWRTRLATGIYPARLLWNFLLEMGGLSKQFCKAVIDKNKEDEELRGLLLLCARQLYTFEYFDTINQILMQRKVTRNMGVKLSNEEI